MKERNIAAGEREGPVGLSGESPPPRAPSRHTQAGRPVAPVLPLHPPPKSGS